MAALSRAARFCAAALIVITLGACDSPLDVDTPRNEYMDRVALPQAELIGEAVSMIVPVDTSGTDTTLQHRPISIAFVVDASGSIDAATSAAFRAGCHAALDSLDGVKDEGALVFYTQTATLAQGVTTEIPRLRNAVNAIPADGASAMWDGIHKAMLELQARASHTRKAVIVFSDGDDNSSTTGTPAKIVSLGQSDGIRVYSIARSVTSHAAVLKNIAESTGGTHHLQPSLEQIDDICREIVHALLTP